MESITGTWRLLSFKVMNETEEIMFPLGKNVKGLLLFNEDGYMSGMISGGNRPDVTSPALAGIPKEERAEIAKNFIAYAGKYKVEKDMVIHDVDVSFIPNLMRGPSHIQFYNVKNETLTIISKSPPIEGKKEIKVILTWKKYKYPLE